MAKNIRTDKLDTCTAMLEDCIVGYFAGNSPQTTIHISYAVITIIRDLSKQLRKKNIGLYFQTVEETTAKVNADSDMKKIFRKGNHFDPHEHSRVVDRSNFVKHADRDALSKTLYSGVEDREQLFIAVKDHQNFITVLLGESQVTTAGAILDLPELKEPRHIKLRNLFFDFHEECNNLLRKTPNSDNPETEILVIDELKRKFSETIQAKDLYGIRSNYDRLVLIPVLTEKISERFKPAGPAL